MIQIFISLIVLLALLIFFTNKSLKQSKKDWQILNELIEKANHTFSTKEELNTFFDEFVTKANKIHNPLIKPKLNEIYGFLKGLQKGFEMKEEIKNSIEVSSRVKYITEEEKLKTIDFITSYSFKDSKEVYTNGTILVPLFRVIDAISQNGEPYQESN